MIALYLIASHMVGDFLFQTRFQAEHKLTDYRYRCRHVITYTLAFIPVAAVEARSFGWAAGFLLWLLILHYATDSRRFYSTLGDWVTFWPHRSAYYANFPKHTRQPANPWAPTPIMVDQTLHLVQLAILGAVFLR